MFKSYEECRAYWLKYVLPKHQKDWEEEEKAKKLAHQKMLLQHKSKNKNKKKKRK